MSSNNSKLMWVLHSNLCAHRSPDIYLIAFAVYAVFWIYFFNHTYCQVCDADHSKNLQCHVRSHWLVRSGLVKLTFRDALLSNKEQ